MSEPRRRTILIPIVGVVVAVALGVALWLLQPAPEPPERPKATKAPIDHPKRPKSWKARPLGTELRKPLRKKRQLGLRALDDDAPTPSVVEEIGVAAIDEEPSLHPSDIRGIRDAMDERYEAFKACYETHLHLTPGLEGKLTISMTLEPIDEPEADIYNVHFVENTIDAPVMEECIASLVEELRFEPPEAGLTVVHWPMVFDPGTASGEEPNPAP